MANVEVEIKGGAKEAKKPKRPEAPKAEKQVDPNVRRIVRISTTDLDGTLPLKRALLKVKGVSFMLSNAICVSTGMDPKKLTGLLSENEVKTLNDAIVSQAKSPTLYKWLLNRRNDPSSGTTGHIVGDNLLFRQREDINLMKRMRSRRGIRHELGLPVRGQRTKSTGRHGRGVGVMRKTAAAAAAPKPAAPTPAAAPAPKPAAKGGK